MATDAITDLQYSQLLEIISAFQWLPVENRLRVEPRRVRDSGPGCQVYGCLHHLAAAIERQISGNRLPPQFIQSFLIQYVQRYSLLQRIDGDSVVTEVQRLVRTIGVDLELIGVGNAYVAACGLVMRRVVPLEWNRFCDYTEKIDWKVPLSQCGTQSRADYVADSLCVEPVCEPMAAEVPTVNPDESQQVTVSKGLATAFENQEFAATADSILNSCRDGNVEDGETDSMPPSSAPLAAGPQLSQPRSRWGFGR